MRTDLNLLWFIQLEVKVFTLYKCATLWLQAVYLVGMDLLAYH